jgi:hypothetical protein
MIHPLNKTKLCWDWVIIALVRHLPCCLACACADALLLQVLYSAVMVPWSISFALHDSCDAPGAAREGCVPDALKART